MGFNFISSDPLANPIIGRSLAHTTLYPGIHHSWVVSISFFFSFFLSHETVAFLCILYFQVLSLSLSLFCMWLSHIYPFLKKKKIRTTFYFSFFLPPSCFSLSSDSCWVSVFSFLLHASLSLPPCLPPTSCLCLFHRSLLDRTDPSDWMHCSVGVNRKTVKHLDLLASCKTCQMQHRIPKNFIFPT